MGNGKVLGRTQCGIGRQICFHRGLDLQHVIKARDVVHVAMREYSNVNLIQVHSQRFHVVLEMIGVVAGIKKNGLPVVTHQRRKAPIKNGAMLLVTEGIVEIQDRVLPGAGCLSGWTL